MKKVSQEPLKAPTPSTDVSLISYIRASAEEGNWSHLNDRLPYSTLSPSLYEPNEANLEGTSHARLIKVIKLLAVSAAGSQETMSPRSCGQDRWKCSLGVARVGVLGGGGC